MTTKTKNIINWVLASLVGLIFIGSGFNKIVGNEEALKMAQAFGISPTDFKILGLVEIISVLLFIYPRTGIIGTLLLSSFMGGAIATHLEHAQLILAPAIVTALVWIVAINRFSELRNRILGSSN